MSVKAEQKSLGTLTSPITNRITFEIPHTVNHILKIPAALMLTHFW